MRALVWRAVAMAGMVTAAAVAASGVEAQVRRPPLLRRVVPPNGTAKVYFGLSFLGAQPLGDFGELVNDAVGGQLDVTVPIALDGKLRIRGELGGLRYGHEDQHYCSPAPVGCRIELEVTTDNAIGFGGVGAEFARVADVSPYGNATIGFSHFSTFSMLSDEGFTEHVHDDVLAGQIGGGVRIQLSHGRFPLLADVGFHLHLNDSPDYLIEGDVSDLPNGQIAFTPRHGDANLIAFQVGGAIGFGRRRPEPPRGRFGR